MENSFSYTVDNLKADHESALQLERNKLTDANEKINKKEKEIEDLLKAYKKMREEIEVLTSQEANKKDLTLKFPGATADLLATKNVFDVFLKTKVLDVCGDAKENISWFCFSTISLLFLSFGQSAFDYLFEFLET